MAIKNYHFWLSSMGKNLLGRRCRDNQGSTVVCMRAKV